MRGTYLVLLGVLFLVAACQEQVVNAPPLSCGEGLIMKDGACVAVGENSTAVSDVVVFKLTGKPFKFIMNGVDSPELKVKLGQTVRIEFTNLEGFHDWVLDEFNARTRQMTANNSETIEFVADKKGTFEYYCSVGTHRQMGMKGNFIVE
jgi:plastocyanin